MAAPSWYVWIKAMHEPDQDMGLDQLKRQTYGFNIMAQRSVDRSSPGELELELASVLVASGGWACGSTLFVGAFAVIPSGDGPYTTIISTGGLAPEATQSSPLSYRNPSAQIKVHAKDPATALAKSQAAWALLAVVRNRAVTA